jgi:hypothetical protein
MVSILHPETTPLEPAKAELETIFGPAGMESESYPFELTDYYEDEMGCGLQRVWIAFSRLGGAEELADWKLKCASLEDGMSEDGSRVYNLDPGYMDHGKLVLASFKGAPDKIYMGRGVWAHTCLRYRFGGFRAPDHSFPDFSDGRFQPFMTEARKYYSRLLREDRNPD